MTGPKISGFLCNWCSYRGRGWRGYGSSEIPAKHEDRPACPAVGRISPELVLRTFREGADGVIVLGCHIGDCHYSTGNHRTAKRMPVLKKLLEYSGIEPERLYINWVSAAEGEKFAAVIRSAASAVTAGRGGSGGLPPHAQTHPKRAAARHASTAEVAARRARAMDRLTMGRIVLAKLAETTVAARGSRDSPTTNPLAFPRSA